MQSTNVNIDPARGVQHSIAKIDKQKGSLKCLDKTKSRDCIGPACLYRSLRTAIHRSGGDQHHPLPLNMDYMSGPHFMQYVWQGSSNMK